MIHWARALKNELTGHSRVWLSVIIGYHSSNISLSRLCRKYHLSVMADAEALGQLLGPLQSQNLGNDRSPIDVLGGCLKSGDTLIW